MYEHENNVGGAMMRGSSTLSGFVLGAIVGAGLALLMAPATGQDTRRRLRETAQRFRDQAGRKVHDAQSVIGEIREDARSAFDAGREAYSKSRQQRSETYSTDPATSQR
jgi:gas vesicle protein